MKRLAAIGLLLTPLLLLGGAPAPAVSGTSLSYHWPIKPFNRQHPIRGAFGDPRTLAPDQPFGVTYPGDSEPPLAYAFHTGVDIVAKRGTPVYPVVSGVVVKATAKEIAVHSLGDRSFVYFHLRRHARLGQHVVAGKSVLGWIQRPFDHVHLTERDAGHLQNPLAPGHLEPYFDHTKPKAVALDFGTRRAAHLTRGGLLGKHRTLAIQAVDQPAMPVPGPFAGLPQTPAFVEWRLRIGRAWAIWHVAADFRRTEPPPGRDYFWDVYAAGTYNNSPVFDHRLYKGVPGRYLFRVRLHRRSLAHGTNAIQTRVTDIRGNSSTATWPLEIAGS